MTRNSGLVLPLNPPPPSEPARWRLRGHIVRSATLRLIIRIVIAMVFHAAGGGSGGLFGDFSVFPG